MLRVEEEAEKFVDSRVAKVLAHPLRVSILNHAGQGEISPKEFADKVGAQLTLVSYHFRVLKEYDCIKLVKRVPVRGAYEHRYRLTKNAFEFGNRLIPSAVDGNGESPSDRMQYLMDRFREAQAARTFGDRDDAIVFCEAGEVDDVGWSKLTAAMKRLIAEALTIQAESAKRISRKDGEPLPITFSLMSFESPQRDS